MKKPPRCLAKLGPEKGRAAATAEAQRPASTTSRPGRPKARAAAPPAAQRAAGILTRLPRGWAGRDSGLRKWAGRLRRGTRGGGGSRPRREGRALRGPGGPRLRRHLRGRPRGGARDHTPRPGVGAACLLEGGASSHRPRPPRPPGPTPAGLWGRSSGAGSRKPFPGPRELLDGEIGSKPLLGLLVPRVPPSGAGFRADFTEISLSPHHGSTSWCSHG